MSLAFAVFEEKSRLRALLDHFVDCEDYEAIATWGKAHLSFLRRYFALLPWRVRQVLADALDEPH